MIRTTKDLQAAAIHGYNENQQLLAVPLITANPVHFILNKGRHTLKKTNNNPPSYVRAPSIASSKSVAAVKIPGVKFQGRQLEINIENLK